MATGMPYSPSPPIFAKAIEPSRKTVWIAFAVALMFVFAHALAGGARRAIRV